MSNPTMGDSTISDPTMGDTTMDDANPTSGARLKAAREQRGMSVEKAADEIHVDTWVVDALEACDYARIGPMVFVKGHLKRYAELLGLPIDEIMSDLEPPRAAGGMRERRRFPRPARKPSRTVAPAQASAAVAAALALVGLLWWQPWDRHERATASTSPATDAEVVRAPESAAEANDDDEVTAPTAPTALSAAPPAATRARSGDGVMNSAANAASGGAGARAVATASRPPVMAPVPVVMAPAAATTGGAATAGAATDSKAPRPVRARLRLSFTSDSWVDVRDALGNRAFAGNGAANTVQTIAGAAPLHVYLRSASGVQMEINGRAVAIGPQFFSGDVARFEAGADGVLRREQTPARPPG
jgi:cytoskeleton protein RodZ